MRFLCAFLLLFPLCTRAQDFSLRNQVGTFEVELQRFNWMGVGNLYDTITDRYQVWLSGEDSIRFAAFYRPNKQHQVTVLSKRHMLIFRQSVADNPKPEPMYYPYYMEYPKTPFIFDFTLGSGGQSIEGWPEMKILNYSEMEREVSLECKSEQFEGSWKATAFAMHWIVQAVLHQKNEPYPNYTKYTIRKQSKEVRDSILRLMNPVHFESAQLDSLENVTKSRLKNSKTQLEQFMKAAAEREAVTWEYFYFQDLHSDTGRTFQSFFQDSDSLIALVLYDLPELNRPYIRVLDYYNRNHPSTPVQVIWLYEKEKSSLPLPEQSPLYGLTSFERNRLGLTERLFAIVTRDGNVVDRSSSYRKFYEFLKAVGGVEE